MNTTNGDVEPASLSQRLATELKMMALMMLYFACWLAPLLVVKNLLLEEYDVPLTRLSVAMVGALVLSKVEDGSLCWRCNCRAAPGEGV